MNKTNMQLAVLDAKKSLLDFYEKANRIYTEMGEIVEKMESPDETERQFKKDECEYNAGFFEPCSGFEPVANDHGVIYCTYCNSLIEKPEAVEPDNILKIMKSGGAYISEFNGVDYFWFSTAAMNDFEVEEAKKTGLISRYWKSFTGDNPDIKEITDEIAKYRPMVVCKGDLLKLYGVMDLMEYNFIAIKQDSTPERWNDIRLATVSDLEALNE